MHNKVLIIHGWSDDAESFRPLKEWLVTQGRPSTDVFLGNYQSMQDDVRFDDLAEGLQARLDYLVKAGKISLDPFSLDVIVHSTGGPVVRHWLHYYLT
jgi:triacylglycerol esterase/lipase EstA (alpha/beta hydrolase family)